ncbi:MAG: 30S ribosomal protein S20 [Firmicutes bacterium]|nr:30S ribosomal protein S20 [Bacillota bacterium]
MANSRSARKRIRIAAKRTERNRHVKSTVRSAVRNFHRALESGDNAEQALRLAIRRIDRAVSKGVLHRNTGARKKSRLTKHFNKLQAQEQ